MGHIVRAPSSGIRLAGSLSWGMHLCHLYSDGTDASSALLPYFKAGLDNGEMCLWIAASPLSAAGACTQLRTVEPRIDEFLARGQLEIRDHDEWRVLQGSGALDAVIEGLLRREEEALRLGFAGLRLGGSTFSPGLDTRPSFAEYQGRIDRAFQDRRILALCSYPLAQFGIGEIVDALRNHHMTVIRREGHWETVTNATAIVAVMDAHRNASSHPHTAAQAGPRSGGRAPRHEVQIYEQPEFLARRIAEFVREGLAHDEGVLLVLEAPHRELVSEALTAAGVDETRALDTGRLICTEARETLSRFMVGGHPRDELFREAVRPFLLSMQRRGRRIRAFGEMVNVLAREGQGGAAIELEEQWNRLIAEEGITLLCGYQLDHLVNLESADGFGRVCQLHTRVFPAEGEATGESGRDADRLIAELQHATRALAFESGRRRNLDAAERDARRLAEEVARHLALLQQVTSALSGAATPEDIADVVVREIAAAVDADRAALAVPEEKGESLRLLGASAIPSMANRRFSEFAVNAPLALAAAYRDRESLWLSTADAILDRFPQLARVRAGAVVCLPLMVAHESIGAVGFAFRHEQEFSPAKRALLEDLARQVALALERALLFRKAAEDRREAEEANRAKDEFLAMLGHELRNPLSPIVTALELMRLKSADQDLDRERIVIERQVRTLVRLVDDLLDVYRVIRGKIMLRKKVQETALLVTRAIETASAVIEERGHMLHVNVPPRGLLVEVDEPRMAQVISNLLINAAKYTPPGGHITVDARNEGSEVEIRVGDTGTGIEPHLLPHLFDLFRQGDRSSDRAPGGLGIGLTVARTLVELHGGSVGASSAGLGQGSLFTVRLPACHLETGPGGRAFAGLDEDGASAKASCRVLIVDDNRDAADSLGVALELMGYTVRVAYDASMALEIIRTFQPQAALLDIGLPRMDGYELATCLREQAANGPPRLIAITGYGQESDRARTRAAGFDLHLVKPVDLAQIEAALGQA